MVPITHQRVHRRHHQLRVKVQVYLPSLILPSPCSLPTFCVFCARPATDVNMHVLGVCILPKGLEIASAIAMSTASWYFLVLRSPSQCLIQTCRCGGTKTCTIVPHAEYIFRNPMKENRRSKEGAKKEKRRTKNEKRR